MRPSRLLAFSLLSLLSPLALAATQTGCYNAKNDCNLFDCGAGGTSSTSSTSTGGGTGGTGGGTPDECIPSEAPGPVADGCGIFVSPSGADGNTGTKSKPLLTLAAAAEKAKDHGKRVYVCGATFTETAVLATDVTLYGGLDCDKAWDYSNSSPAELTAAADTIPLTIAEGVHVTLFDINVTAADAVAPGASSIALLAENGATVDLHRSDIKSGLGAQGESGGNIGGAGKAGDAGPTGSDACNAAQTVTPDPPINDCGTEPSIGGNGGVGNSTFGTNGTAGSPGPDNAGAGEAITLCTDGTDGADGADGMAGSGATGLGALDTTGHVGTGGEDGKSGASGQGGGGGGGAKGGTGATKCTMAAKQGGASGGAGGSGGCGGGGGKGGKPGGSSMALVGLGATFTFEAVTIAAKNGGTGGNGGTGQAGGFGGFGGIGGTVPPTASDLHAACNGGQGGKGGRGGTGGGGLGGHSIGIAFLGGAPDTTGAMIFVGQAGNGGAGDGMNEITAGQKGVAKDVQPF